MRISDWSSDVCSSDLLNQLPPQSQQPIITLSTGESTDSMYIGFYSDTLAGNQITDYLLRVVKPKLQTVPGVQTAEILGERQFALRAWLDPDKLAAHGLTAQDIYAAMAANNYRSEEHTSELQSLMRISYAVFCLQQKKKKKQ